jgi:chromosome segregation ATPase
LSAEKAKTIKYDSDKCVLQEQISELMRQLGEKNEEVLWWQGRETSVRQAEQELDQRTREADKRHAKKAEELKQRERACREAEERLRVMDAELRSSSAGTVASRASSQDTVVRQEETPDNHNAQQNHVAGRRSPRVKNAPVLCHLAALAAPKKKAKRQILITSSDSESDSDSD